MLWADSQSALSGSSSRSVNSCTMANCLITLSPNELTLKQNSGLNFAPSANLCTMANCLITLSPFGERVGVRGERNYSALLDY